MKLTYNDNNFSVEIDVPYTADETQRAKVRQIFNDTVSKLEAEKAS